MLLPARPAAVAIMPHAPGRPHFTELLLRGHHCRVSQTALAVDGAAAFSTDGIPLALGHEAAGPPG